MIFIFGCVGWKGVSYDGVAYPAWAEAVGWFIALLTAIWIPIFIIKGFCETEGTLLEVSFAFDSVLYHKSSDKSHGAYQKFFLFSVALPVDFS